ncbi:hypothetical protein [Wenxinia marina]|uniref:Class I SAM-dependent methyltransferase n=1 Tax=Wenxinia marina DSM 24838 TaxID=1123501 RepID=A0A0D0PBH2_9RHOB|nr:hypothetical protein [Wenxinia marina]KIQ68766.1 hypothetical protein Wenmar_02493 [Wenxinia marina DSM 24838]GGL65321.1 hypothetical protein GCM10011392_20050 [Wenxinia marina]
MAETAALQPPELRLPEAEAALLRDLYGRARAILEYGSGGSTAVAAEQPEADVFTVESDADWIARLEAWFTAHPPKARLRFHHADIGPTAKWGKPADNRAWRRFHRYPLGVWDRDDFVQPDVVLIDGRFRTGCFLATLFRTAAPVTVLFDDYAGRAPYHVVERFGAPAEIVGRMARFEVTPRPIEGADLDFIMTEFTRRH